jgi:protoheme IX farnesyltransferase
MIKTYFMLTKPGIIFGNVVTMVGGFALASKGHFNFWLFLATLVGLSCIIASACVFNNYIDRTADEKMIRTRNRALVKGLVSERNALAFATFLGFVGSFVLASCTNLLTLFMALVGYFVYVVLYSFSKYRSTYGTVVGSIAGAMPPVVGYCAVTNHFDIAAFILFMIVALWQMPHFFAIAMYRFNDYKAALIPVLPVKKGMYITKIHMLLYIIAFIIATLLLTLCGYTGYVYFTVVALLGFTWLGLCIKGFTSNNDTLWARKMFLFSLVVIMVLCAMISVDVIQEVIA